MKTIAEKSKRLVSEYSFLPRTRKKSDVFLLGEVEFDLNMGACEKFEIFDVLLIDQRILQNLCEKRTVSVVCFNFFCRNLGWVGGRGLGLCTESHFPFDVRLHV